MEKANDAVEGNDRNQIMRVRRRRMESFLLCVKITLPVNLFLNRFETDLDRQNPPNILAFIIA